MKNFVFNFLAITFFSFFIEFIAYGQSAAVYFTDEYSDTIINDYISQQENLLKATHKLDFLDIDFLPYQQIVNDLYNNLDNNLEALRANCASNCSDFIGLEERRLQMIKATLYVDYFHAQGANFYENFEENRSLVLPVIKKEMSKVDLNYEQNARIEEFYDFFCCLLSMDRESYDVFEMYNDVINDEELLELPQDKIDSLISNEKLLEYLYYHYIMLSTTDENLQRIWFQKYRKYIKNEKYIAEIEDYFWGFDRILPGNPSINWSFLNKDGNRVSLSDFKGQYVL